MRYFKFKCLELKSNTSILFDAPEIVSKLLGVFSATVWKWNLTNDFWDQKGYLKDNHSLITFLFLNQIEWFFQDLIFRRLRIKFDRKIWKQKSRFGIICNYIFKISNSRHFSTLLQKYLGLKIFWNMFGS